MYRLFSGIKKEFLLLVRDLPGLSILFLMPVLLIMIVTLAQQNALKSSKESKTELLFVDCSHSALSLSIRQNLTGSSLFKLIEVKDGKPVDRGTAKQAVSQGAYPVALMIAEHDSALTLLVDPSLQEAYKNSITSSVTFFIKGSQSRIAIETLLKTMSPGMDSVIDKMVRTSIESMTPVKEIYATAENAVIKPSVIQNNVPGFILFAMFFIVIPLSGSLITEKSEGSYQRLITLPVHLSIVLSSKVIIYLFVCLLQFLLMLLAGTWLLPTFFGLPHLQLGDHYAAIAVATVSASLAAIGFGLIVGSLASTQGQAALFGSVMVVILGVISGTFLPVYLLPKPLQYLSLISPIRWGIDNYLVIFIREGTILSILPNILLLLLFFIFAMIFSITIFARNK